MIGMMNDHVGIYHARYNLLIKRKKVERMEEILLYMVWACIVPITAFSCLDNHHHALVSIINPYRGDAVIGIIC